MNNQLDDGSPELTLGCGTVNTVITSNSAMYGGGVYFGAGILELDQASITQNTAQSGGGLYLVNGTSWNGDPYGYIWDNWPDNVAQGTN